MTNWTPVANIPPLDTPMLVTDGKQILVGKLIEPCWPDSKPCWEACGVEGYEWEWDFDTHLKCPITHWAPLPSLPGENE